MKSWPGILLAPTIALSNMALVYALVTPSCAYQNVSAMHAATALSLLATLVITFVAWRDWQARRDGAGTDSDSADVSARRRFLGFIATCNGALFSLVILAHWIAQWLLSPCTS